MMKEKKEQKNDKDGLLTKFDTISRKSLSQTQQLAASEKQRIVANDNASKKDRLPKAKPELTEGQKLQRQEDLLQIERENFLLMDQAYQEAVGQMQKDTKSEYSAKGRTLTAFGSYRTNNSAEMETVMKAKDLQLQELIFGTGGRNVSVDRLEQQEKIQIAREKSYWSKQDEKRQAIDGKAKKQFNQSKQKPLKIKYGPILKGQKKVGAEQQFNRKIERENQKLKEAKWRLKEPQRKQEAEKSRLQQEQESKIRKAELIKKGNATQERIKSNLTQNKIQRKEQVKERINGLAQQQKEFNEKQVSDQMIRSKRLQSEKKIEAFYKPNELKKQMQSLNQRLEQSNNLWGRVSGKHAKLQQDQYNLRLTEKSLNENMTFERAKTEKKIKGLHEESIVSTEHSRNPKLYRGVEADSKDISQGSSPDTRMAARIKSSFTRSSDRGRDI